MKILRQILAGAKFAPALLILLYYLFAGLDIYTTYLVTPDMRFEGNWIVLLFNLNWSYFFIFYSLIVLLVTIGLLIALNFLNKYFQDKSLSLNHSLVNELFNNNRILLSFIMLGCFYSHIINLGFININNYLGYIYYFQIDNCLRKISSRYISNQHFFWFYIQILPIVIGYFVAVYKLKNIRNKYRTIPA
jgi:hypothetical protein